MKSSWSSGDLHLWMAMARPCHPLRDCTCDYPHQQFARLLPSVGRHSGKITRSILCPVGRWYHHHCDAADILAAPVCPSNPSFEWLFFSSHVLLGIHGPLRNTNRKSNVSQSCSSIPKSRVISVDHSGNLSMAALCRSMPMLPVGVPHLPQVRTCVKHSPLYVKRVSTCS